MWAYNGAVDFIEWESLEDGLAFVLQKLWPHRETLSRYAARGEFIWWCGHFQSRFDGGPCLSAGIMTKLGEIGASLYIDNYFSEPE
jgi:hypothetical protein